jgi:divalent metal cation (Fe/Co/Zn/Cd) transporter
MGVGLQALSIATDLFLGTRSRRLSRRLFSPVLEVHWRTCFTSAAITCSMMLGLLLTILLHEQAWSVYIDPVCALTFIAYGAVTFLPTIASELETLADKTLKEEFQLRIDRRLAEHAAGYSGFHGVRSRRVGGRLFIEIALSFPAQMPAGECMATVNALREGIGLDVPGSDVSVVLHGITGPLEQGDRQGS